MKALEIISKLIDEYNRDFDARRGLARRCGYSEKTINAFASTKINDLKQIEKALKVLDILVYDYYLEEDFDCSYEEFLSRYEHNEEEYPRERFELVKEVLRKDKSE